MDPSSRACQRSRLGYYGWRVVLPACLGVMAGFGSLFIYTFSVFVKPLAAEFGWSREAYICERGSDAHKSAAVAHSGMTWQRGLLSFAFWIITTILFVSSISMNGAITHLSALLTDRGITAENAALCASILGGSSLLGREGRTTSSSAVNLRSTFDLASPALGSNSNPHGASISELSIGTTFSSAVTKTL
ncbi:MAG: hypothetical protein WAL56_24765 [Candidatus Sulfotelmatobacter sp.]